MLVRQRINSGSMTFIHNLLSALFAALHIRMQNRLPKVCLHSGMKIQPLHLWSYRRKEKKESLLVKKKGGKAL
jgi:hypothetical protein